MRALRIIWKRTRSLLLRYKPASVRPQRLGETAPAHVALNQLCCAVSLPLRKVLVFTQLALGLDGDVALGELFLQPTELRSLPSPRSIGFSLRCLRCLRCLRFLIPGQATFFPG